MIYTNKEYCLEVKGSMACFTRPEMKVERVSYDIITPSAARAIFESIFWKPAIQWNITRIEVLNPIRWFSMKRNEIGSLMSPRSSGLYNPQNQKSRFQKRKIKKNGKRFVDSLYSLIDLKTI